jgi:hypothetical protein
MLRGNLATRPFYNERLVGLGVALVAVVALAVSVFNGQQLVELTRQRADFENRIAANEQQAAVIRRQAEATQRTVDRKHLQLLVNQTHEANDLIDQRTFSWTALMEVIERTLPIDVRLVAVSPKIDKDGTLITMIVVSRKDEALAAFVSALEGAAGSGTFYDVLKHADQLNDDGTYNATILAYYLPPSGAPSSGRAGTAGRGSSAGSAAPKGRAAGGRP